MVRTIKLERIEDIKKFTMGCREVDGNVRLIRDNTNIDGKSFLGIYAIEPDVPFEVHYPDTAAAFDRILVNFVV